MLVAEQRCGQNTHNRPWSVALRNAGLTLRYWLLRLKEHRCGQQLTSSLTTLRLKVSTISDSGDTSISYILSHLREARANHCKVKCDARANRDDHLQSLATQEAARHHQVEAHVLQRILTAERQKAIFHKLNHVLQRNQSNSLTYLKVPAAACQPGSNMPIPGLDNYPTTSDHWIPIDTKDALEAHLIARNNTHYRQANCTPFGNTPRGTHLGYHGTSVAADSILDGTYSFRLDELTAEAQAYLQALRHPDSNLPPSDRRPTISTAMSIEDLVAGFSKWPESTSTSPSGRHLGHYHALLYDSPVDTGNVPDDDPEPRPLFRILQRMINIPFLTWLPPKCWLCATSVCIEKEPNNPSTDKIRIIHLFEADLNFIWKLIWGKRLVHRAENDNLYPEEQYGSRPGRSASSAVLSKVLIAEYCRASRLNLGWLDNDCTANYDRIVCSLSSIACQRLGLPKRAEELHNNTLLHMRYTIKTGSGLSDTTYGSEPASPVQGQGQGAGNAPSCWGAISTPIWAALQKVCPYRFTCQSADKQSTVELQGVGFVDDATNFLNDLNCPPMDEVTLSHSLQSLAQSWERLLYTTGGALKPQKCFYYLLLWDWANGFPILRSKQKCSSTLSITDSNTNAQVTLEMKGPCESTRTLGIRISPSRDQSAEIHWLTQKSATFARLIRKGHLTRTEARQAYRTIFIPSITYSLGVTAISPSDAYDIQKPALAAFLSAQGINHNMDRAVVFGPESAGGLNLRCLYTEQGCLQIENLLGHLWLEDRIGHQIYNTLSILQFTAGTSGSILSNPNPLLPHLPSGWITSICDFLRHIGGKIIIPGSLQLSCI